MKFSQKENFQILSNAPLNIISASETSSKNDVNSLSEMVIKKNPFFVKSSKFRLVWTIRFCSNFISIWYKIFLRNVWRDFRLSRLALPTVARTSLNGKFTAKTDFPIRHFYVSIADADIGSFSINYLISI